MWTVPNILTVVRLAAAPLIVLIYVILPHPFSDMVALALFVTTALTDWVDGYLARKWNQESKLGAMLDPIADKAIVIIAIVVLVGLNRMHTLIVIPAAFILFREVFVSGLREFLGDTAGTLKVTRLAKWKTAAQMCAIAVLLSVGIFEHYTGMLSYGMDFETSQAILAGELKDPLGLRWFHGMMWNSWYFGLTLWWLAGLLTVATGVDYLRKAWPHLQD